MLDASDDSEIVRRILKGEINAYEHLMNRYKDHALKIIKRRVPTSEVEDVTQEVFVKAYQSLSNFDPESQFQKWLSTIAVRTCYDYWRRTYRDREMSISELSDKHRGWLAAVISSESTASADIMVQQEEAREVLDWAMDQLSPEDRSVMELVYLEGRTGKEAAEMLGWSRTNVKVRAFRARKKLKKLLSHILKKEDQ